MEVRCAAEGSATRPLGEDYLFALAGQPFFDPGHHHEQKEAFNKHNWEPKEETKTLNPE
jgi:hypothetical protein